MDQPIERHSQAMGLAALQMFSLSCNIEAEMSREKCKVLAWSMRTAQNGGSGGRSASTHPSVVLLLLRGVTITDLSTLQSFVIQTPVNFLLLFFLWRYLSSWCPHPLTIHCHFNWLLSDCYPWCFTEIISEDIIFFCLAFPPPSPLFTCYLLVCHYGK